MTDLGLKGGKKMLEVVRQLVESLGPGESVSIGFMEGAMAGWNGPRPLHGKTETSKRANASSNQVPAAQVAFWMEYGTTSNTSGAMAPGNTHIPPRPFFRNMIEAQSPTWGKLTQAALKMSKNQSTLALEIIGMKIGEQLQESIIMTNSPPLAESTVARKGNSTVLVDSHNMLRAVSYAVKGMASVPVNGGA